MGIADNLKKIRRKKGLKQKEVAAQLGLKPAHYNKIENGFVEPSVVLLDKLASFYGVTIDDIVHLSNSDPKEIAKEDKSSAEQLRLLAQLNDKDKSIVMDIIDTMLTKHRFQTFFEQNLATK